MENPDLKNRRRKNDGAVVLDDAGSPPYPPLKSAKREEDVPENNKGNSVDVRNNEEPGQQSVASSGTREPKPLVPASPEVLQLRQLLVASKQQQLNLEQQLIASKQHSLNLEQQLVNASQMLINWEQQTAAKEDMYQRACQAAQESELHAERAEKAEKKITDLTNQLEEEKLQSDMRENNLMDQLVEEREERKRADQTIEQLTRKLAEYEGLELEEGEIVDSEAAVDDRTVESTEPVINTTAHMHNIFNLLDSTSENSISIDEAVEYVRDAFEKCGEEARRRLKKKTFLHDCDLCGVKTPKKLDVTNHFLSEGHIKKVRASKASVSYLAVKVFVVSLMQIEKAAKRGGK